MNNNTTIYGKTSFDVQKEILDKRNHNEAIEFYCELTINSKNNVICCSCDSDMMNSRELDRIREFIRTELTNIVYDILNPKMAYAAIPRFYRVGQAIQNHDVTDDINDMITYPQFRYTNTSDLSDLVKIIICSSTKSCDIYCIDNKSNTVIKEITSTNKLTPIQLLIMGIADDIAICNVIRNINSLNMSRVFDLLMNTSSALDIKSKDESDLFEMFMERYGQTYVYNYLPRSKQNNNMSIVIENSFGIAGTEEVFSYMTDGSNNYCKFFCDGMVNVPSTVPVTVDVVNNEPDFDEIVSDMLMSADEAIERLNRESLDAIKKGEEERESEKCSEPELRGDVPAVPVSDDDNRCDGNCSDCPKCCSEETTTKSNEEPKNSDDILSNVIELIGKLSSEISKLHEKSKR